MSNQSITLDEFCKKFSLNDKRVELIGGFYHYMKDTKKMLRASEAVYQNQFKTFCNMPA